MPEMMVSHRCTVQKRTEQASVVNVSGVIDSQSMTTDLRKGVLEKNGAEVLHGIILSFPMVRLMLLRVLLLDDRAEADAKGKEGCFQDGGAIDLANPLIREHLRPDFHRCR
jgi:hypothetical protein